MSAPGKKKVLFVHPLGVNWTPGQTDMARIANIMPPIGLCGLAAWLDKFGHETAIHDCYAFPGSDEKIVARLKEMKPDFLGVSVTTSGFMDGLRLARLARTVLPRIKTIFGGVHVSALGASLLERFEEIDYAVVGEGEETMRELVESDGEEPSAIPGLLWREGEAVHFSGAREGLLDLDDLPFPAYEKLEGYPRAYALPIFNYPTAPNTTAVSSRGCVFQCSYCDRSVFGRSFRFNSPEYMAALVQNLNERFGVRHINFYDDLFTLNRPRVEGFCEQMRRRRPRVTFNCAARAETIDEELLSDLKDAGCWMISLGIETGDSDLLARHRSKADLEMIRDKVHMIRKSGIRAKGLFMLGLPGETLESIQRSMDYAMSLPLNEFNLAKFTPFPGSPAYADITEHGRFDEDWEQMNCLNFVFVPEGLTREKLESEYMRFYRTYFKRPRVLWNYVAMLWRSPDSWRRFLLNFTDFMKVRKQFSGADET